MMPQGDYTYDPLSCGLLSRVRGRTFSPEVVPGSRTGVHAAMSEIRLNEAYTWQAAYNAAILETDNAAMPLRVYEALAAIEQRCLSPIEEDSEEDRALRAAEVGLQTLRAERTGFEALNSISAEA